MRVSGSAASLWSLDLVVCLGGQLQMTAQRRDMAFTLRSIRSREGAKCLFRFVTPWLRCAWGLTMISSLPGATAQLFLVPEALRLEQTASTKWSTPRHVDSKNLSMSVVCASDVTRGGSGSLRGGSHVIFDAESNFAIIVDADQSAVALIGPYCRLLHGKLATLKDDRLVLVAYTSEGVMHKRGCW
eukprot:2269689-Pleurochrysis_carterae.AAC.1